MTIAQMCADEDDEPVICSQEALEQQVSPIALHVHKIVRPESTEI